MRGGAGREAENFLSGIPIFAPLHSRAFALEKLPTAMNDDRHLTQSRNGAKTQRIRNFLPRFPVAVTKRVRLGAVIAACSRRILWKIGDVSAQEITEQIKALPSEERARETKFVIESDDSWIPEEFKEGMADIAAGHVVDLDTALNETYPWEGRRCQGNDCQGNSPERCSSYSSDNHSFDFGFSGLERQGDDAKG
jgi:hypothetical protein